MEKILFVNSCVRENSRTYRLAETVLDCLDGDITRLDISEADIKPLDRQSLAQRIELSDMGTFDNDMFRYARQFADSDTVVIAAPYWDLSFPAVLKAYLEAVSVCGITFRYDENGAPAGLCNVRKLIYVTTSGGSIGEFNMGYDYVRALAQGLFGIRNILFFSAENLDIYGNDVEAIMQEAEAEVREVLKQPCQTVSLQIKN